MLIDNHSPWWYEVCSDEQPITSGPKNQSVLGTQKPDHQRGQQREKRERQVQDPQRRRSQSLFLVAKSKIKTQQTNPKHTNKHKTKEKDHAQCWSCSPSSEPPRKRGRSARKRRRECEHLSHGSSSELWSASDSRQPVELPRRANLWLPWLIRVETPYPIDWYVRDSQDLHK